LTAGDGPGRVCQNSLTTGNSRFCTLLVATAALTDCVSRMKRHPVPELLDTDSGTPAEIAGALSDLCFINRNFGGFGTTEAMIKRVAEASGRHSLSFLEVAAGSGYMPKAIRRRMQAWGIQLQVSLLDRAWSHLHEGSNGVPPTDGYHAAAGDALALPFRDESFDLVSCNLFTHHLSPEQTVQYVNEALRTCRIAVLVNDLVRSGLHLALVYAGLPLFHSRMTWHDAPASVRQAYTLEEMRTIFEQTHAAKIEIRKHYLFRMGVIAWKSAGQS
jgi:ubiquinone/menaquinone biosynthesis C-methylase UbiE